MLKDLHVHLFEELTSKIVDRDPMIWKLLETPLGVNILADYIRNFICVHLCVVPEGEEVRGVEVEGGGAVLVLRLDDGHARLQQARPARVAPHPGSLLLSSVLTLER